MCPCGERGRGLRAIADGWACRWPGGRSGCGNRTRISRAPGYAARLAFVLVLFGLPAAWAAGVTLLLSEQGPAYTEAAEAFAARLGETRNLRILQLDALQERELQQLTREAGLLVPVGLKATRAVAQQASVQSAVLALMVPRSGFEAETWPAGLPRRRVSAVFIDQPPERSLHLIERLLPNARRLGVLYSPLSQPYLPPLNQEAHRRGLILRLADVSQTGGVAGGLRRVLTEADVLLLLPDAQVVNAGNVQHLLLTTYRYRVPVIGFSQSLVRAGAVAAVYSTPAQIGAQGGEIARRWLQGGGELPAPRHCDEYAIAYNHHVARSLGIRLPHATDPGGEP